MEIQVNISAQWFRRRDGKWSVRLEWTTRSGEPRRDTFHTELADIVEARGDIVVAQVFRQIARAGPLFRRVCPECHGEGNVPGDRGPGLNLG